MFITVNNLLGVFKSPKSRDPKNNLFWKQYVVKDHVPASVKLDSRSSFNFSGLLFYCSQYLSCATSSVILFTYWLSVSWGLSSDQNKKFFFHSKSHGEFLSFSWVKFQSFFHVEIINFEPLYRNENLVNLFSTVKNEKSVLKITVCEFLSFSWVKFELFFHVEILNFWPSLPWKWMNFYSAF